MSDSLVVLPPGGAQALYDAVNRLSASLAAAEAERDALIVRRDELLAAMVRVTRETPYPEEAGSAATLIAEVGTLRSQVTALTSDRNHWRERAERAERDRDEHKAQHNNAVSCWRADVAILGATLDTARAETAEQIAAWLESIRTPGHLPSPETDELAADIRAGSWAAKAKEGK